MLKIEEEKEQHIVSEDKVACGDNRDCTSEDSVVPDTIDDHLINFGKPWFLIPGFVKLNAYILFLTIACVACGYDGSLLNGLQSLEQWNDYFGNPTGVRLGLLASGFSIGTSVVSIRIADILSDKLGRKNAIVIGQSFIIIGSIIQGTSKNYAQFFIARIINGFSYIAPIAAPVLIAELAYPTHRGIATGFHNLSWYLGSLLSSCVCFGTFLHFSKTDENAWRIPSYIQGVCPLINILFIWLIPESPRYLINKGRHEEARNFFIEYHANGDEQLGRDLVDFEMREIETALKYEKISNTTSFMTFFKSKTNFHRLSIVAFGGFMMNFSGNGLLSYFLPKVLSSIGITNSRKQLEINILLGMFNYVTSIMSALCAGRLKRRFMYLTSTGGMFLCFIVWTTLSAINQETNFENAALGRGVLAMIFLFEAFYNFAILVMPPVYTSEIMPYNLRAKGYTVFSLISNLGNIYNGLVNPIAMDAIDWKYYIVYNCILLVEVLFVYFVFVETHGYTMEEVSEIVFKEEVTKVVAKVEKNGNGEV